MSDGALKKIVREIRGDVKVEPGLRGALIAANNKFRDIFTVCEETNPLDGSIVPIVFCKDPASFFESVIDKRGALKEDVILRINIDDGRQFLKVKGRTEFANLLLF